MNHTVRGLEEHGQDSAGSLSPVEMIAFVVEIFRRHSRICLITPTLFALIAIIYVVTTPPEYSATAVMVIDTRKTATEPLADNQQQDPPIDNPTVESQAEILKSENIALSVIRNLKLKDDPGFNAPSLAGRMFGAIAHLTGTSRAATEYERERALVEEFASRLNVKRLGVTFVFEVGFIHRDREQAARIANAVADAYVREELEARKAMAARNARWLQERLQELGRQAQDAEIAVVEFKRRNNIIDTGGRLLNEQQLAEINSQLAIARANAIEATAKFERIQSVIQTDVLDANVTDALHNEVIIKLRNQYTDIEKRAVELAARVGNAHHAVMRMHEELAEVRKLIIGELKRIATGYQSDHQIAVARVESIQNSLNELVSQAQATSKAQIEVKALDSQAQSYRTLFDSFLQHYAESAQRQSSPLIEARVITKATPPLKKAKPKIGMTILGATVFGAAAGFAAAAACELMNRTIRSASEAEAQIQAPCIAIIPLIGAAKSGATAVSVARLSGLLCEAFDRARQSRGWLGDAIRHLSRDLLPPTERADESIAPMTPLEFVRTLALRDPLFVNAVRAIKAETQMCAARHGPSIVGIASALPGEGKSTIAIGLAVSLARSSLRVALVEMNELALNDGTGSEPNPASGVASSSFRRHRTDALGFDLYVADGAGHAPDAFHLSPTIRPLIEEIKEHYDYVLIELPALIGVGDPRATLELVDEILVIVEYAHSAVDFRRAGVAALFRARQKIVGVVLNKSPERRAMPAGHVAMPSFNSTTTLSL